MTLSAPDTPARRRLAAFAAASVAAHVVLLAALEAMYSRTPPLAPAQIAPVRMIDMAALDMAPGQGAAQDGTQGGAGVPAPVQSQAPSVAAPQPAPPRAAPPSETPPAQEPEEEPASPPAQTQAPAPTPAPTLAPAPTPAPDGGGQAAAPAPAPGAAPGGTDRRGADGPGGGADLVIPGVRYQGVRRGSLAWFGHAIECMTLELRHDEYCADIGPVYVAETGVRIPNEFEELYREVMARRERYQGALDSTTGACEPLAGGNMAQRACVDDDTPRIRDLVR